MLNQPDQANTSYECTHLKDPFGTTVDYQISDADSAKESAKQCSRCKVTSHAGTAKKNVNQRAKVTVQRRANSNQKVVSLSFDKAIELSTLGSLKALDKPTIQDVEANKANINQVQPEGSDGENYEKKEASVVLQHAPEINLETVSDGAFSRVEPRPTDRPVASSHEDEVVSFSTESQAQHIAPPPIRLRQAWASPTLASRQHHVINESKSKATNTETRSEKTKQSQSQRRTAERPASGNKDVVQKSADIKDKTGDTSNFDKQPGTEAARPKSGNLSNQVIDEPQESAITSVQQSQIKPNQKIHIDVRLSQVDQCETAYRASAQAESKKRVIGSVRKNKKPKNADEGATESVKTKSINVPDKKSHGMGDAEIVPTGEETQSHKNAETYLDDDSPKTENGPENATTKQKKIRKMGASLFSWHPFKKKSGLKQKTDEANSATSSEWDKTFGTGYVAKTSMTDVLCMQGRLTVPRSLTEMFAASNPEKADTASPDLQGRK